MNSFDDTFAQAFADEINNSIFMGMMDFLNVPVPMDKKAHDEFADTLQQLKIYHEFLLRTGASSAHLKDVENELDEAKRMSQRIQSV